MSAPAPALGGVVAGPGAAPTLLTRGTGRRIATFAVIVRLMAFSPWRFGLAVASSVLVFGLPVATGLVVKRFFDALAGVPAEGVFPAGYGVWAVIALFAAVGVAEMVSDAGLSYGWITFLHRSMALLRRNVLQELVAPRGARALPESPGAVLNRVTGDSEEIVESVDAWIDMVGRTVFVVGAVAVMLRIDAGLTLVVLLPLTVVVTAANMAEGRIETYRRATREAAGEVAGFLGEAFGAAQALHVAGGAPHAVRRLEELGERRRRLALRDRTFFELLEAFNWNIVHLATGAVLLLAGSAMREGRFTVGDFALFVTYLASVTYFPMEIARWLTGYRQAGVSVGRLAELLPAGDAGALVRPASLPLSGPPPPPPDKAAPAASAPADGNTAPTRTGAGGLQTLTVSDLVYRYPGAGRGVGPVSLTVRRGTLTVITGRIGAGKSTLLHAVLGLLPREGGTVSLNGRPLEEGALAPPLSAFTPQVPRLFSETLRDNILAGLSEPGADLPRALHLAALERDVASMPLGLETVVGPRGVRLSGGQLQRAAAARMLVRAPDLLVFDDLSSALDVETEARLWERLFARPGALTLLVVSHRRAVLERADNVVLLAGGQVVAQGTLPALLESCEAMRDLWLSEEGAA